MPREPRPTLTCNIHSKSCDTEDGECCVDPDCELCVAWYADIKWKTCPSTKRYQMTPEELSQSAMDRIDSTILIKFSDWSGVQATDTVTSKTFTWSWGTADINFPDDLLDDTKALSSDWIRHIVGFVHWSRTKSPSEDIYYGEAKTKAATKCTCGVAFTGGAHSDWCDI